MPKAQASYDDASLCIQEMTVYSYKEYILYTQLTAVLIFNVMLRDFVKGQLLYMCFLFVSLSYFEENLFISVSCIL